MPDATRIPEGRLDLVAARLLKIGLERHGNPALELAMKLVEGQVNQALIEGLGPDSAAGRFAKRVIAGAAEIDGKVRAAQAEIERERAARARR
jgi:hypothetical protein